MMTESFSTLIDTFSIEWNDLWSRRFRRTRARICFNFEWTFYLVHFWPASTTIHLHQVSWDHWRWLPFVCSKCASCSYPKAHKNQEATALVKYFLSEMKCSKLQRSIDHLDICRLFQGEWKWFSTIARTHTHTHTSKSLPRLMWNTTSGT